MSTTKGSLTVDRSLWTSCQSRNYIHQSVVDDDPAVSSKEKRSLEARRRLAPPFSSRACECDLESPEKFFHAITIPPDFPFAPNSKTFSNFLIIPSKIIIQSGKLKKIAKYVFPGKWHHFLDFRVIDIRDLRYRFVQNPSAVRAPSHRSKRSLFSAEGFPFLTRESYNARDDKGQVRLDNIAVGRSIYNPSCLDALQGCYSCQ